MFKIQLDCQLDPGDGFDVEYAIEWPFELARLSRSQWMMSIALFRYVRGVERLEFSVSLPQRPTSCLARCTDKFGQIVDCTSPVGLLQSHGLYTMTLHVDSPTALVYMIYYQF